MRTIIARNRPHHIIVEVANFLRSVPLFAEFEPAEIEELRKSLLTTQFAAKDIILEEGNANRALHIVGKGRIRVARLVGDGEVPLCDLSAGQTFGELSIIDDGVASATLYALTPTEVLSLSSDALSTFLRDRPVAAAKFWRALAGELRRRLISTNDVVRTYFEMNRALVENPTFRDAYALCNR
jgi:CRP/FNR family transcriptional regulator, cyclic AMP receptor protein